MAMAGNPLGDWKLSSFQPEAISHPDSYREAIGTSSLLLHSFQFTNKNLKKYQRRRSQNPYSQHRGRKLWDQESPEGRRRVSAWVFRPRCRKNALKKAPFLLFRFLWASKENENSPSLRVIRRRRIVSRSGRRVKNLFSILNGLDYLQNLGLIFSSHFFRKPS